MASPPSLPARLAPWLGRFSDCTREWTHLPTHAHCLGVLIELNVELTDALLTVDDDGDDWLMELREAIDLVLLTLAVEPSELEPLLRKDSWENFSSDDEDAVQSVIAHGARTELRLKFFHNGTKTQRLLHPFTTRFLRDHGATLSPNESFLSLRQELLERLQQDPAAFARFQAVKTPVTMVINSGKREEIDLVAAGDFFTFLTMFSKAIVAHQSQSGPQLWPIETRHAPLKIDGFELWMYRFCITHVVAQAAQAFVTAGIPVQLRLLNLDPRLISTIDQDVRDYVAALTTASKELVIYTGVDPSDEISDLMDEDDQDRRATIAVILDTVAHVNNVEELNVGGLFSLFRMPENRRKIWSSLFQHILSRDPKPDTISFEDDIVLIEEDAEAIRNVAARWRQTHPGKKLCIKKVKLWLEIADVEAIEAFVNAVDDIEGLELVNRGSDALPTRILYRILSYPSLKRLTIGKVLVPSMDIFDPAIEDPNTPNKPVLEELTFEDLILEDRLSMSRFLEKLRFDVEEPSLLAKSLRRFHVTQGALGNSEVYITDEAALSSLSRVLESNRILCDVEMLADYSENCVAQSAGLMKRYSETPLRAIAKTRHSDIAKARILAFFSVIRDGESTDRTSARMRLDAGVVSRILEFASPHQLRNANLLYWED